MNDQLINMSEYEKQARFAAMDTALKDLTSDSRLGFLCAVVIEDINSIVEPVERQQLAEKFAAFFNANVSMGFVDANEVDVIDV